jgi:hypothetical protein
MFDVHGTSISPAPAAPPPPPPPSESDADSVRSVTLDDDDHHNVRSNVYKAGDYDNRSYGSYQSSSSSSSRTKSTAAIRPAPIPTITNYGVSPVVKSNKVYADNDNDNDNVPNPMMRGDPHLKPNTGETNDVFGGFGSLRELVSRLRWITIASTILAIIWEGFAFPSRLLVQAWIYPAKVVLGAYLGIFCLLLLGVELNAPLRHNFGILYHPLGRGALLFLMAGMCFGILAAWWEALLGMAFFACGVGYVYCYARYPEYRRWQDYNDNQVWKEVRSMVQRNTTGTTNAAISWAQPNDADSGWEAVQRETQSLLHQV